MSWDAIAAIAEAAGAFGVLISIIYLASQVRLNTEESRIARGQDLITANADVNAQVADNPELSRIVRAGMLDFSSLSEEEQFRFSLLFFSFMTKNDFGYRQWLAGKLEEPLWERTEYEMQTFLSLAGARAWWERDRPRFSSEFAEHVDSLIKKAPSTNELPTIGNIKNQSST